jgi:hypothetical protein
MIVGLGEDMNQCIPSDPEVEANEDEAIVYRATVYATSTTDGTSFSTPFVINSVPGGTEGYPH